MSKSLLADIKSQIRIMNELNEAAHKMRNDDDTFTRGQASGMEIITRNMVDNLTEIYNRGVQNEEK
jgi:hypothetical protein